MRHKVMNKYTQLIDLLRSQGKSDDEIAKMLVGTTRFSAIDAFAFIMSAFTDEEMTKLEKIQDSEEMKKNAIELFHQKTGLSPEELVDGIQEGLISILLTSKG